MPESPVTNEQIEHLRQRLVGLETQKRIALPTPEVGRWVWFYKQGDTSTDPIAALVTRQDGPGQVTLECHQPHAQTHINVTGVHFKDHPFLVTNPQVAKMKNGGVWDFKEGDAATEKHKKLHLKQIDTQIKSTNDELLKAIEDEMRRRDRDSALSATQPAKTEKPTKATASAAS